MSNAQRALWTFLMYTFVAPFFGALAVVIAVGLASLFGLSTLLPADLPPLGAIAIGAYVWSVIPAVLTGLALAPIAFRDPRLGWVVVAVAGAISFAIATVLSPIEPESVRPYLAFLAGLIAIGVREVLVRAGVVVS